MMLYADSSALLKRYVDEHDSSVAGTRRPNRSDPLRCDRTSLASPTTDL
jgi:predicted nucleic acid-binding protein